MFIKSRKLPGEIFIEFSEKYALSNKGRWYSNKSKRIMKQHKNSSGYYRVKLYIGDVHKWVFTHINVVRLFGDCNNNTIPEYTHSLFEKGLSIDHIDGNKKHNYVANLEIVTHQENCIRRSKRYAKQL